ncbi:MULTISPECIES: Lsr2 family DNA-binding protein [Streptomyces]|uniref:Lsr2 family DNA-binding protein n=1 Tax=Streptomyces TaxID=1883 RepID=UPI001E5AF0B8|nr:MULTISPECIES: histone-like nucleoid-structuring protein Lsr2 [Streptomyces]UFQ16435.1 Lsr2 family protein [Streptomyces huasconensis]WCL86037.1 Lsr2 family protein [Streptomyces sp. JCM 35825]
MDTLCKGCKVKDEEVEAVSIIAVGTRVWDLCQVHAERFEGYLADLFQDTGEAEPVAPRPTVVVTGEVPGYDHETARTLIENLGYRIAGHVQEDTAVIVCGLRPAQHKVAEAREHGTPAFDATAPSALALALRSGDLEGLAYPSVDDLRVVQTMTPKKTAADLKAQAEAEDRWREEKNRRLSESRVEWAKERKAKEDAEIRRLVQAQTPPEQTENQKIRAWAKENGFEVKARGAIPAHVREAYRHATAGQEELPVVVAE